PHEGVLNLWASDSLDPGSARPLTHERRRGIRSFFWAEDRKSLIYLQDKDGDENWHLHQVEVSSGAARDITPYPEVQAQVLATDPKFPDEILVAMNRRDKRLHDVYRIDLRGGEPVLIAQNPGDAMGWLADAQFQVRGHRAVLPDGGGALRLREADGSWRELLRWGPDDSVGAHGFSPDAKSLYLESSLGSDTSRLVEFELATGKVREILSDPEADVGPVLLHPTTYALQAVGFETDRLRWKALDPSLASDLAALSSAESDAHLVSRDDEDRLWVLLDHCDRKTPSYRIYDRGTKRSTFLFTTRPELEGYALAAMKPVRITARDGLTLPAYLTLPKGERKNGLPLILRVHGGPWARDSWGFNPEVQWLADRGYAVLQVNYRGSSGFGKKFLHAADRQWGAAMQDDLSDCARWAVEQGIADPAKLAIYGGSYGGYAALAGAAFTPDLYACAVDLVGPSNLITLIRSVPPYWEPLRRVFDLRVGNVDTEEEFLKSRSPLFSAESICIPLLIAQGANDPRVKQAESEQIVSALRAKGKPVEYLLFPDEGHGLARPENREVFYAAAEPFLAKHLGGRSQDLGGGPLPDGDRTRHSLAEGLGHTSSG
ncbi:MAG: S9 family peptidase, partial [Elusimicrobiota bacterium]